MLTNTLDDPRLYAYVRRDDESSLISVYETADPGLSSRRKRKRETLPTAEETAELQDLKERLNSVKLKSWPYVGLRWYLHATDADVVDVVYHETQPYSCEA